MVSKLEIADLAELREKYSRPEPPKCRLCGHKMTIGMMGQGRIEWYCNGPEAEWMGMEDGPEKRKREDHYSASRHIQTRCGDSDVIRLIDAYESERDSTPVDWTWASSAGFTPDPNEPGMLCLEKVWLIFDEQRQQCLSVYVDGFRIHGPSIGQVCTMARLANITLTEKNNAQQ